MSTLFVLRHAKSSWKNPDLADHDRPLNKRGKRDAPRMGRLMREEGLLPQLALSSTAKRARLTLDQALEAARHQCEVHLTPRLYLAGPEQIVEVLRGLPGQFERVLVVGHNPGLEELVGELTGEDVILPTAALAVVDCASQAWGELRLSGEAQLVRLWQPRELPAD